jgi:Protein of unknown function (DUF2818)
VGQGASVWLVIVLALAAANLPFASVRVLGVLPVSRAKTLWMHLAELLVLYLVVGGLAVLLESRMSQRAPQGWEFYAITGCLFLTFAFPGFVWRYLMRRGA